MTRVNTLLIFAAILIVLWLVYFRVLSSDSFISKEVRLYFTETPTMIKINMPATLEWKIESPFKKEARYIALHYGQNSITNPQSSRDYPLDSTVLSGIIPGKYSVVLQFQSPGSYYIRAHVIVNEVNYWSPEAVINVVK